MATSRTGSTQWIRLRKRLIATREHRCHWCGRPLDPAAKPRTPAAIELDHIIPVASGGTNETTNLTLACYPCNRSKSDRMMVPKTRAELRRARAY